VTSPTSSSEQSPAPAELSAADIAALQQAVAAEHAAVFTYGLVLAHAQDHRRAQIQDHLAAHRDRRDHATALLTGAGADVPAAAAGYTVDRVVDSPQAAADLAVLIEEQTAQSWYALLESARTAELRTLGAEALTDCAVRAARWRVAAGIVPATTAFPGRPDQDSAR